MEGAWLARMRWRRRGAWQWPAFIAAVVFDAAVGHLLPPSGDSQKLFAAGLVGLLLNLLGVVVLSRPLALLVRRARRDLPAVVARDYAGTAIVCVIAALLALAGVLHHATITGDRAAMRDAVSRAQAWIGDRAPAEFRRNVQWVSTYAIQSGSIYRACVPSASDQRTYCVVVNEQLPFARSVSFDGYEPNSLFSEGVW